MKLLKGIAGAPGIVSARILYFEKGRKQAHDLSIDEAQEKALEK